MAAEICMLCKSKGIFYLNAHLSIDPVTYSKNNKVYACGHWVRFCDNCWDIVLQIEGMIIEKLFRDGWKKAVSMYGNEIERKEFAKKILNSFPSKSI